jgi:hypothetical protein
MVGSDKKKLQAAHFRSMTNHVIKINEKLTNFYTREDFESYI